MIGFDNITTFKKFLSYLKDKFVSIKDNYDVLETNDKTILGSINEVNSVVDIDYNSFITQINDLNSELNNINEE